MYRNDGKILTEEDLHTPTETRPSATFAATNLTGTALEFKAVLPSESWASNCLNHGTTETINTPAV
jgi:L,D-peptidoglycan transpeptidase YkuD (ErfK/YbiS/YcfS/YnhG family)